MGKKANIIIISALIVIAALVIVLIFTSDENKTTEQHRELGKEAIQIVDLYLDYEISAKEACERIEILGERAESELPEIDSTSQDERYNYVVESRITMLYFDFSIIQMNNSSKGEKYAEIIEARNEIAEAVGAKTRE